ncbi:MAG: hypothetical protein H0T42_24255 [Deltaproteobacteria bacterium]|nr:hypothetical protein [Deltaproteobacteria bacterium]
MLLIVALGACGEDEPPPPPPRPPGAPAAAAPAAAPGGGLSPRPKVEERVLDEAEKATIRHQFRDRDFAVEVGNRDPFQSFVLGQQGMAPREATRLPREVTKKCMRADQFVASNYSYTDLRLVGIVAERAQRRVLMMDAGNLGHIIKKGDCVGREKAVVKDIGVGFITFQVQPEDSSTGQVRTVEEHSVQLYPNQMPVKSQPTPDVAPTTQVPVVAPGGASAPAAPQTAPVVSP